MQSGNLTRFLGPVRGFALTLGVVVGSGIYILPAYVAPLVPHAAWFLGVWGLVGLVSVCVAAAYAELATTFPRTGGYVVYLQEIFGDRMAFVYGWAALLVLYPSGIASVAHAFALSVLHLTGWVVDARALAVGLVAFAVFVHLLGAEPSTRTQVLLSGAKVLGLTLLALAGLLFAPKGSEAEVAPTAVPLALGSIAMAYVIASWCFDGFLEIVVVAGEVDRPARILWRVLVGTVVGVTVLYSLYAGALLKVLGLGGIGASTSVAADMSARVFGAGGGVAVDLLVILSTASGVVAVLFSGPRLLVALAERGLFFDFAGRVSSRGVPSGALLVMGAAAAVYASVGSLGELVKYFQVTTGVFSALIVGGGVWLRVRGWIPAECRRIPGWPWPPVVALLAALGGAVAVVVDQPRASLVGLLLMALAVPMSGWGIGRRG